MRVRPLGACGVLLLLAACGRPSALPVAAPGAPGEAVATRSASADNAKAIAASRGRSATRLVATPVAGKVVRVVAPPGTEVVAGEPLAWLASPAFDTAAARLRAARAEEATALERLRAARAAAAPGAVPPSEAAWQLAEQRRVALAAELKWIIPSGRVADDAVLYPLRAPAPGTVVASSAAPGGEVPAGGALFTLAVREDGVPPAPGASRPAAQVR